MYSLQWSGWVRYSFNLGRSIQISRSVTMGFCPAALFVCPPPPFLRILSMLCKLVECLNVLLLFAPFSPVLEICLSLSSFLYLYFLLQVLLNEKYINMYIYTCFTLTSDRVVYNCFREIVQYFKNLMRENVPCVIFQNERLT